MKNRATTNQKPTTDPQNPKRREHKHNGQKKKQKTGRRNKINRKTKFKMTMNKYLSIIKCQWISALSKDTEWQTGLKKNKSLQHAAYKRPTLGQRTPTD